MSEQPPKKIGSLKDRIAAFESGNKSSEATPPERGARPKPGHLGQWKPRERSPPSSPPSASKSIGGDIEDDPAESMGKMSLKERMAALQGRGGFGAPAPPPVPIQRSDKPKWKPPTPAATAQSPPGVGAGLVLASTAGSEDETKEGSVRSPEGEMGDVTSAGEEQEQVDQGEGGENDEEGERKRRAAIAARMAKLGGARFGMAPPPIYASKPKPNASSKQTSGNEETEAGAAGADSEEMKIDLPKAPSQTSLVSESSSLRSSPAQSMPIPTGPRRAGPPRRRPPKSPGASQTDLALSPSSEDPPSTAVPASEGGTPVDAAERDEQKLEAEAGVAAADEEEREETEEEAAARRKRIAERIAKSGGLNFLSAPRPEEEEGEPDAEAGVETAHQPEVAPEHDADTPAQDREELHDRGEEAILDAEGEDTAKAGDAENDEYKLEVTPGVEEPGVVDEEEKAPILPPKSKTSGGSQAAEHVAFPSKPDSPQPADFAEDVADREDELTGVVKDGKEKAVKAEKDVDEE